MYVCDRMKCSKSYWKCDQADCKGRCIQNRNFIQETKKDNHVPDPVNVTPLSAGTYVNDPHPDNKFYEGWCRCFSCVANTLRPDIYKFSPEWKWL